METLDTRIKAFLSKTYGDGFGRGSGGVFGYGEGFGSGCGSADSRGNSRCLYGVSGNCDSYGYGEGDGYGDGYGSEYGEGCGYGSITGCYIKELNGNKVYSVDNIQTIITSVHGNIAQGFMLHSDLTLHPCYIVKEQNKFAHGETLHDAFAALQEKLYDDSTEEERIEAFLKKFPNYDTPYPNRDLFTYHHVLTGSCRMGRESFCKDKGINLDDSTTVREFVRLTKDSYSSETIRELPQAYGVDGIAE